MFSRMAKRPLKNPNELLDGYIVAGPPSTFRFRSTDSKTVRFLAVFALLARFVRFLRSDAHVSQL